MRTTGVALPGLQVRIERKIYSGADTRRNGDVIRDLAFSIPPREFCCIVGPSGCGKTTMLNIVAGLDHEASADVRFSDGSSPEAAPIGYMFQTPRLLPWRTVRDNVGIVLDHQAAASGRVEQILREMELGDSLDAYPGQLSGGMQRRVALARAFVIEPRLLLLDEPFVSLDQPVANRLRGMLLNLWERRPTTVLFVTHDMREAIYLADRILFLSKSPARVILDVKVDLPRPRRFEDPAAEDLRRALLSRHEALLQGLTSDEEDGQGGEAQAGGAEKMKRQDNAGRDKENRGWNASHVEHT